jgi:hypothetical protein
MKKKVPVYNNGNASKRTPNSSVTKVKLCKHYRIIIARKSFALLLKPVSF